MKKINVDIIWKRVEKLYIEISKKKFGYRQKMLGKIGNFLCY